MSAEIAIVFGLGLISVILCYFAFQLSESPEDLNKKIGLLLAFMSLVFLNLVMYAIYQIAKNNASYLINGVLNTGLLVMMWTTAIIVFVFAAVLFIGLLKALYQTGKDWGKRRVEDE